MGVFESKKTVRGFRSKTPPYDPLRSTQQLYELILRAFAILVPGLDISLQFFAPRGQSQGLCLLEKRALSQHNYKK
jgi:hypothetical protein